MVKSIMYKPLLFSETNAPAFHSCSLKHLFCSALRAGFAGCALHAAAAAKSLRDSFPSKRKLTPSADALPAIRCGWQIKYA